MASVSVDDLGGGRYKIRWRELLPGEDGKPERGEDGRLIRRSRSLTVEGKAARDEAVARVRRALLEEGEYLSPTASEVPRIANLETAAVAWLEWKKTRCKPRSVVAYATHMARFFALLRKLRGIGKDEVVYANVLSRDLLISCMREWQGTSHSESWVYSCSRSVIDMWRWVSDDSERYPGVPLPPREAKMVLPRVPIYIAPPAPTVAELDACLRRLSPDATESRRVGTLLRYTGLRISQVVGMKRQDIDLEHATLTVTVGKSRQEEAEQRTIPLSPHLIREIASWLRLRKPDDFLFPAWGVVGAKRHATKKDEPFRDAWNEATRLGEARKSVWKPANRHIARPAHAFRAGFQAYLRTQGVGEEVIDALVGHHGRSLRASHYAGIDTLWDRMQEAVEIIPAIDWAGPSQGTVIPLTKRRKGA